MLDSFASRTLRNIAEMARLRGAVTVIVGIQPDVAFAMVQLGMDTGSVVTALDLEEGLATLDRAISIRPPDVGGDRTRRSPAGLPRRVPALPDPAGRGGAARWLPARPRRPRRRFTLLELVRVHHDVLIDVLRDSLPGEAPELAAAASDLLLEVLATYEMTQRGLPPASGGSG